MPWRRFREDFEGAYAVVAIDSTGVTLSGEKGGTLHVPLSRIRLARAGFTESKSARLYELRLWVDGLPRPLQLCPHGVANHGPYKATVHALAAAMAEQGTLQRMHTGVSRFDALLGPVLMAIVVIAAFLVPVLVIEQPAWWHYIVIPLVPTFIFGILAWQAFGRRWPRPLRNLADLDRQLPR